MQIRGGEKVEAALADIARKLKSGGTLRVGFLAGATYPASKKGDLRSDYKDRKKQKIAGAIAGVSGGMPVAAVAAFQNFGTAKIPRRPFFTNMVINKSPGWPRAVALNLKATGYDSQKTLDLVGEGIEGQLRREIIATNSPPLAASTIARKGFEKPLIDSSHMINSVDHEVAMS